jgi:excisionase family DNA binding protein
MATDPPTDAPRTGDPMAPPSESPASIGTNRRRKPQPHHRPATTELGAASDAMASLARAIAELVRVEVDARVRAALAGRPAAAELLSTAEAAQYAKVSPRSIRRWLDQGKLRALHAGPRAADPPRRSRPAHARRGPAQDRALARGTRARAGGRGLTTWEGSNTMHYMSEARDCQLTIRLPRRLRDAIDREAEDSMHSAADIVVLALEERYGAKRPHKRSK